jgi:hypothetical protein
LNFFSPEFFKRYSLSNMRSSGVIFAQRWNWHRCAMCSQVRFPYKKTVCQIIRKVIQKNTAVTCTPASMTPLCNRVSWYWNQDHCQAGEGSFCCKSLQNIFKTFLDHWPLPDRCTLLGPCSTYGSKMIFSQYRVYGYQ